MMEVNPVDYIISDDGSNFTRRPSPYFIKVKGENVKENINKGRKVKKKNSTKLNWEDMQRTMNELTQHNWQMNADVSLVYRSDWLELT